MGKIYPERLNRDFRNTDENKRILEAYESVVAEGSSVDFKSEVEKAIANVGYGNIVTIVRKIAEKYDDKSLVKGTISLMAKGYQNKAKELEKSLRWI